MLAFMQRTVAREGLMRSAAPLFGPLNPFLPEYRADPHATWHRLREEKPTFWSHLFVAWVLTRYDDVLECLQHPATSCDRSNLALSRLIQWFNRNDPEFSGFFERNLLMLEGTDHRRPAAPPRAGRGVGDCRWQARA